MVTFFKTSGLFQPPPCQIGLRKFVGEEEKGLVRVELWDKEIIRGTRIAGNHKDIGN